MYLSACIPVAPKAGKARQGEPGWLLAPCISRYHRLGSSWYRGDCSYPESQLAQAAAEQHYVRVNKLD